MGGMSGSPIVTRHGVIGIVSLSSAVTGTDDPPHCEGGPQAYLPLALPGWILNKNPKGNLTNLVVKAQQNSSREQRELT
jgi:hypothetical protein